VISEKTAELEMKYQKHIQEDRLVLARLKQDQEKNGINTLKIPRRRISSSEKEAETRRRSTPWSFRRKLPR
jgi:hypothetical protein